MTDDREISKDELDDLVLRHLRQQNTIDAIAFGIAAGQAAIAEVLTGGPAVLGPKVTTEKGRTDRS